MAKEDLNENNIKWLTDSLSRIEKNQVEGFKRIEDMFGTRDSAFEKLKDDFIQHKSETNVKIAFGSITIGGIWAIVSKLF